MPKLTHSDLVSGSQVEMTNISKDEHAERSCEPNITKRGTKEHPERWCEPNMTKHVTKEHGERSCEQTWPNMALKFVDGQRGGQTDRRMVGHILTCISLNTSHSDLIC